MRTPDGAMLPVGELMRHGREAIRFDAGRLEPKEGVLRSVSRAVLAVAGPARLGEGAMRPSIGTILPDRDATRNRRVRSDRPGGLGDGPRT